jgi:hypothetical protein
MVSILHSLFEHWKSFVSPSRLRRHYDRDHPQIRLVDNLRSKAISAREITNSAAKEEVSNLGVAKKG